VVAGRIVAGPHVRAACSRHLRDRESEPLDTLGRPYRWEAGNVARVLDFFGHVLKLDGGADEPKAFVPEPWQAFVLGSLFGWVDADGFRRFRLAFVETGKGSGKSPLAAGVGLYMLMADGERRAEVYAAAVDKEQAGILFKDAVSMSKLAPAINGRVTRSGGEGREYNIAHLDTGSFFRPISSESQGRGKSGYRPHCVLLDEIHEHPTNAMVEFMRAGTKGRRQALIFMITNSGVDRTSVCYEYHQYGAEVAAGDRKDESFFSYICALDDGEDPLEYRSCWQKANPSLGVTFPPAYLEEQVRGAKGMPSKESIVRRLNFCEWTDASNPWIDGDLWRACEVGADDFPSDDELRSRPCFLALDLSSKRDLTALAAVWPDGAGGFDARLWFWSPADTLGERENTDRVPYRAWANAGHMAAVPGRSIDYAYVAQQVAELSGSYSLAGLTFDQWRIDDFLRELDASGVEAWAWQGPGKPDGVGLRLIGHGQGFGGGSSERTLWMPRSISVIEEAVMSGKLRVRLNPVLRWNSASALLDSDASGNKKWDKRKSTGRIDGIVALCMGVGAAAWVEAHAPSTYESAGIFYV
jgi:phage terminase large subunit-like protein